LFCVKIYAFDPSLLSDDQELKYIHSVPVIFNIYPNRVIDTNQLTTYYIGLSKRINNLTILNKYSPKMLRNANIISVKASEADLPEIIDLLKGDVEYINQANIRNDNIEPKGIGDVNLAYAPNDPYYDYQWYLNDKFGLKYTEFSEYKKVHKITQNFNSQPVIAIVDAGFYIDEDELNDRIWTNNKEITNNGIDDDNNGYVDDYVGVDTNPNHQFCMPDFNKCIDYFIKYKSFRHGLAMSSIIAAKTNNDKYIAGLAPDDVKILPISAESDDWDGVGHYIEAYDYILDLKKRGVNIIAVNLSVSGKYDPSEEKIMQELAKNDILVIAASGNDNVNIDRKPDTYYPAALVNKVNNIISVGALSKTGVKSDFSNFGNRNVSIYMPGDKIATLYIDKKRFGVMESSGTSQAAAVMSGVISNAYWLYPNLSMIELKDKILKNSKIVNYYYMTNINSITLMDLVHLQ
jgi:hypothetical protein